MLCKSTPSHTTGLDTAYACAHAYDPVLQDAYKGRFTIGVMLRSCPTFRLAPPQRQEPVNVRQRRAVRSRNPRCGHVVRMHFHAGAQTLDERLWGVAALGGMWGMCERG
jgi:hypothetical protein